MCRETTLPTLLPFLVIIPICALVRQAITFPKYFLISTSPDVLKTEKEVTYWNPHVTIVVWEENGEKQNFDVYCVEHPQSDAELMQEDSGATIIQPGVVGVSLMLSSEVSSLCLCSVFRCDENTVATLGGKGRL